MALPNLVNDNESCFRMLRTLRYLGVKSLPPDLMHHLLSEQFDLVQEDIMDWLSLELPSAFLLLELRELPEGIWVEYAMQEGDLQVVQYLVKRAGHAWSKRCTSAAIRSNNLECLQYAVANGCALAANACELAAREAHMQCLQYLRKQNQTFGPNICVEAVRGSAVQDPSLETTVLEYIHQRGEPLTEAGFLEATKLGDLRSLKYFQLHNCFCDAQAAYQTASRHGKLSSLQFLHENGYIWDERVVRTLCQQLDKCSVTSTLRHKYEACLQYCLSHSCPFDQDYIERHKQTNLEAKERFERIFEPASLNLQYLEYESRRKLGVALIKHAIVYFVFALATAKDSVR